MACRPLLAVLVAALWLPVPSSVAEPLTRSCNTGFQANDIMLRVTNPFGVITLLAAVATPSPDPGLFRRLGQPRGAHVIIGQWMSLEYDFDLLVDMDEVAAGLRADPSLSMLGVTDVIPDRNGCSFATLPSPGRVVITEFHNRILDHYFLSSSVKESQAIDSGAAGPGWERTGESFTAAGGGPCDGATPVFRFYGAGPNSHFFTVDPLECGTLHNQDPGWQFEANAFGAILPTKGACSAQMLPLYRLYNNRFAFNDSNHRFVVRTDLYQQMIAKGWVGEGVAMCLPQQ